MREQYGQGVIYNPDAKVGHKVFGYRTRPTWLIERGFWQGYSKWVMQKVRPRVERNRGGSVLDGVHHRSEVVPPVVSGEEHFPVANETLVLLKPYGRYRDDCKEKSGDVIPALYDIEDGLISSIFSCSP